MTKRPKPKIAISSCLLGELVRYNKNHCRDKWVANELSKYAEFVPFCPEMEMGLGVPREEIHLYFNPDERDKIKLKGKVSGQELTDKAIETATLINQRLKESAIDGFILTKKSPSCGIDHVKTVNIDNPQDVTRSAGMYAKSAQDFFPHIPKIDSGRILNLELREHYIKAVYAHYRFRQLAPKASELQAFHQHYKYILMEHSPANLKEMGQLVANHNNDNIEIIMKKYYELFFTTLKIEATKKKRYNALMHVLGYFKKELGQEEKKEVLSIFDEYSSGITSYSTLLRYLELLTKAHKQEYLQDQLFFAPYPKELALNRFL